MLRLPHTCHLALLSTPDVLLKHDPNKASKQRQLREHEGSAIEGRGTSLAVLGNGTDLVFSCALLLPKPSFLDRSLAALIAPKVPSATCAPVVGTPTSRS